ncbi:MAG TPA: B-4DMT family transporter [Mycobacterium sp.]|uniref:B-4DMT family transporter n=1 Tax=Mycobacterium sp. TaxID=1785 RepID=UPI002D71C216|nr:B-4DMT family transporter [Mycobacterium sp.]HXY64257.1 B-4DMT family transporter [Mycobacterium sp.]
MTNWMLRGLVFGAAMVVVRLFQGTLIDVWQTQAGLISIALLVLFLAGVVLWGVIDGRADAAANPDPDRRADLAMTWLLAGLVAGVLSGAVTWLIAVFYKSLYVGGLVNELTVFAAFTALLVFLGGIAGVTVGRYLIDRAGAYTPQHGGGEGDRADTDVFAAVRSEEAAAAEGGGWPREQPTAVATAEREDYGAPEAYSEEVEETTEAVSPAHSEEKTEEVPTTEHTKRDDD